jgi:MFS family permease
MWFVPFANVLKAHRLEWMIPYALACTAVAALISPIVTGAMADRHTSATTLLGYLSITTAGFLGLTFLAIEKGWGSGLILALFQIQQLCSQPCWGLASMIVLASLPDPGRQFGAIRVWGTFGWVFGCLLISFALHADSSTLTGFVSAATWICTGLLSFLLPKITPQTDNTPRRWQDLLGIESFQILKNPAHRSVFLTSGLYSIPLAAFYPFTALQLSELGFQNVSAAMSLGQVTEAIAMYALSPLLRRFELRSLFLASLAIGIARYGLLAGNQLLCLLLGIFLHGVCFTLFFIPAQIYIEHYIDRSMRFRAQALMTLLISGFGNFFGYLGCGWLRTFCSEAGQTRWLHYWMLLAGAVALVAVYFLRSYRPPTAQSSPPLTDPTP